MVGHSGTYYNVGVVPLLPPLNRTATAASASVNVQNYDSVAFSVNVGATGDTWSGTNRVELQVQESADNATWTAVADADLVHVVTGGQSTGTFGILNANAQGSQVYETGYRGNQQYVRVNLANYGTTSVGTPMSVEAIVGRPRTSPINT